MPRPISALAHIGQGHLGSHGGPEEGPDPNTLRKHRVLEYLGKEITIPISK